MAIEKPAEPTQEKNGKRPRRKRMALAILSVAIILVGAGALYYYLYYTRTHISTDDAFVDGNVYTVASKVSGTVRALYIKDNQFVKKGELILEIDPRDYEVQVKGAQAGLEASQSKLTEINNSVDTARKQLKGIMANLASARANLELQQANLRLAEKELKRSEFLIKKDFIAKESYDQTKTNYEVAVAQVKAAQDQIRQLEASVETQKAVIKQTESSLSTQQAQIRQNEATLKAAQLNKSYTRIYAPMDGYITNRSVDTGNQIQAAQPLLAVVPLLPEAIWITANYKETQLERVKPGQKVIIKVDAYSGKVFHGKVNSIMSGSGAVFSLFPPQNATGNFVKVVQRIPVKIVLDEGTDPNHVLRIGMSVVPTILIDPG